jgi:hypothetical protein
MMTEARKDTKTKKLVWSQQLSFGLSISPANVLQPALKPPLPLQTTPLPVLHALCHLEHLSSGREAIREIHESLCNYRARRTVLCRLLWLIVPRGATR